MLAWLLLLAHHACALVLPPNPSRGRLSCAAADDDGAARSQFGTKRYWDDMYDGRGDFSGEEYSWASRVLLPGAGNDPTLRSLHAAGWRDLRAVDYSAGAVERLRELLWDLDVDADVGDLRGLAFEARSFDAALEKGALDAVYLAGDGFLEAAADELFRVLRPGGTLVSVSGVVPPGLRRSCFSEDKWDWLRDGATTAAGCFARVRGGVAEGRLDRGDVGRRAVPVEERSHHHEANS
ncbi:methyltransferase [Aureococcus anophagefferens]|nr:methyltransferase [Aureococcus anophagefferens]